MRKLCLALALFFYASDAQAQTAPPTLTLAEAQRIALTQQPLVKAGDLNAAASREAITVARSAYFPQVSGSAVRAISGDNTRIAATTGISDPTIIDRASAGIAAIQLITDFGKTAALVDASRFSFKADQDRALSARDTTLLAVSRAYYQVLRAQALLKVADETEHTRGTLFDQIKALHDVKMKSDLDLSYAEQGVQQADLLELKAKAAINDGRTALAEAMGGNAPQDFALAVPDEIPPPPARAEDLVAAALANNPDVKASSDDAHAAQSRAEAQAREFRPNVSAYGYTGVTPYREPDTRIEPEYATAGINISMPFYTGGRITSQSQADFLHAQASAQSLTDRRNRIVGDARTLFNDAQTAYQNIALTTSLVKNAQQSYDLTQARYQTGNNSIVDVVEAQLTETQSEIDKANATFDYLLILAQLDFTVGNPPPG